MTETTNPPVSPPTPVLGSNQPITSLTRPSNLDVSKNRGTVPPKWMVKIMENTIFLDDLGVFPYFWFNTHLTHTNNKPRSQTLQAVLHQTNESGHIVRPKAVLDDFSTRITMGKKQPKQPKQKILPKMWF